MEELVNRMKVVLATSFSFYLKAQYYHWNVEGINFPQYHQFFANLYEEIHESIDQTAEQIRALDAYAPGSLKRYKELSEIMCDENIPSAAMMCKNLLDDNQKLILSLTFARAEAERLRQFGLINYLEGRIDIHKKHHWMLKSVIKG